MSGLFPSQTSQTSTTTGSPQAQRLGEQAFAAGEQVPLNLPAGQRLTGAPANPLQFQGLDLQREFLQSLGPGFGSNIIDLGNQLANPSINPLLGGTIDAATRPVFQAGIESDRLLQLGGEQFGASGGSAEALARSQIASDTQQQVGDIASSLAFGTSERALDRSLNAPGVLGAGLNLSLAPGQQLANVGGQQRQLESIEPNEQLAQFREEQSAPFAGLRQIAQILSGLNFGGQTQNVQPLDQFMQFLQFALGAGALGVGGASLFAGNPAGGGPIPT